MMLSLQEEEVEESMYAYTVKILGDDLNVRPTGQPKDWAATWTLSEIDSGLELSVGIDDEGIWSFKRRVMEDFVQYGSI